MIREYDYCGMVMTEELPKKMSRVTLRCPCLCTCTGAANQQTQVMTDAATQSPPFIPGSQAITVTLAAVVSLSYQ